MSAIRYNIWEDKLDLKCIRYDAEMEVRAKKLEEKEKKERKDDGE